MSEEEYEYAKWLKSQTPKESTEDASTDEVVEEESPQIGSTIQKGPSTEPQTNNEDGSQKKVYQKPETGFSHNGKKITLKQSQVITKLSEYAASDKKYHYEWRTGENYFIEENGKIVMYKRLHSLLDSYIADEPEKTKSIKENAKLL